jgi:hypothetical protein
MYASNIISSLPKIISDPTRIFENASKSILIIPTPKPAVVIAPTDSKYESEKSCP